MSTECLTTMRSARLWCHEFRLLKDFLVITVIKAIPTTNKYDNSITWYIFHTSNCNDLSISILNHFVR